MLGTFVAGQAQPPSGPAASSAAAFVRHSRLPANGGAHGAGKELSTRQSRVGRSAKADSGKAATPAKPESPAVSPSPSPQAGQSGTHAQPSSGNSTANLQAAVQNDIASGNSLLAVAQYLVENGYSDAAAAGVASCIDGESGGNPESVGSGGGGLIGWTPLGSAAPNANIVTGNPAQDMMTQLGDLLYYNSAEIGQSLVAQLNGISDPVSAADFFSQNFEKPAVTFSDVVPSVAQQVFSELTG